MAESFEYQMGYDCGLIGANTANCSFRIFESVRGKEEWERGKRDGEAAKLRKLNE